MRTARMLVVIIATLLLVPAVAGATEAPHTVALVEGPDGLQVVTGGQWQALPGRVVATAAEVALHPQASYSDLGPVELPLNDEFRFAQWALDTLEAEQAWTMSQGQDVVIAIVDSGIDGEHPDLGPTLVEGMSTVAGPPQEDTHGHGTHVAGIAAAVGGNDEGTAGVAPRARLMPIRVFLDGAALSSDVARGVIWAAEHGADVISMSLAGGSSSAVLNAAIDYAIAQGSIVIAAAGNSGEQGNPPMWPASHGPVIAVGATDQHGDVTSFSSYGPYVDLVAPGSRIYSTRPGHRWGNASGTSSATPHVAGAAALLRAVDPDLDQAAMTDLLTGTADDIRPRGWDERSGAGELDAVAALEAIGAEPLPTGTPEDVEEPERAAPPPFERPWDNAAARLAVESSLLDD